MSTDEVKPKVVIRNNGTGHADTVWVMYEDGTNAEYEWEKVDPKVIEEILTELGYDVIMEEYFFEHDVAEFCEED